MFGNKTLCAQTLHGFSHLLIASSFNHTNAVKVNVFISNFLQLESSVALWSWFDGCLPSKEVLSGPANSQQTSRRHKYPIKDSLTELLHVRF